MRELRAHGQKNPDRGYPLRSHRTGRALPNGSPAAAFSLLEMMTVLALLLIFASFALPTYQNIVLRAREAALRDDLYTMRSMIDRFTLDNQRAPASLDELVEAGYLGAIHLTNRTYGEQPAASECATPAFDFNLPSRI